MSREGHSLGYNPEDADSNEARGSKMMLLEPQYIEHVAVEKGSEQTLSQILAWLDSFTSPSQEIIALAQLYIEQLKQETGSSEEPRDEMFPKSLKRQLFKEFGGCVGCGQGVIVAMSRNDEILQPHHIKPREYGGKSSPDNALLVCRSCHRIIHS